MSYTSTIFQQFLSLVTRHHFDRAVEKFQGNRYAKSFTCRGQFFANLYAQIALKDSLRDMKIRGKSVHLSYGAKGQAALPLGSPG